MITVTELSAELLREATKIVTGKLLTESQIKSITGGIVGKYFKDWLPQLQREAEAENRIENARIHITEDTKIISALQDELENQAVQLDILVKDIEEKKSIAERYDVLAKTNQDALAAFKAELEDAVRKELIAQAERGKNIRRIGAFIFWTITLVLGAALGAYLEISFEPLFQQTPK